MSAAQRLPAPAGGARGFWTCHALLPAVAYAVAMTAIWRFDLDRRIAAALFFDAQSRTWRGAGTWWAEPLLHSGGTAFVVLIGLAAIAIHFAARRAPAIRAGAGYVAMSLALCACTVGLLKIATDRDCPRNLAEFGGDRPYVQLFEARPPGLPAAACFPGAHASTGFSLMAFYFVFVRRQPRLALKLLSGALSVGALFSFGQQARGAHFLSHDLTSAAVDWYLLLGLRLLWPGLPALTASSKLRMTRRPA